VPFDSRGPVAKKVPHLLSRPTGDVDDPYYWMSNRDDVDTIAHTLRELADLEHCSLIVTTGGTGPAPRDVTPEATEQVCTKMMPGFGELMRAVSLQVVPTAILSRQTAGIRGSSLIVNLPGKPSAIAECLGAVLPAIPYCVDLIGGARLEVGGGLTAFRPKSA